MTEARTAGEGTRGRPTRDDPRSLRRREDARFLTGRGDYLGDRAPEGEFAAVMLRSPHAHARIRAIDTAAAASLPGVHGVYTAADLDGLAPLPTSITVATVEPLIVPPRWPLARDVVRHVGEPVAFVVAETEAMAREACRAHQHRLRALAAGGHRSARARPTGRRRSSGRRRRATSPSASAAAIPPPWRSAPSPRPPMSSSCDLVNNRIVVGGPSNRASPSRSYEAGQRTATISRSAVPRSTTSAANWHRASSGLPLDQHPGFDARCRRRLRHEERHSIPNMRWCSGPRDGSGGRCAGCAERIEEFTVRRPCPRQSQHRAAGARPATGAFSRSMSRRSPISAPMSPRSVPAAEPTPAAAAMGGALRHPRHGDGCARRLHQHRADRRLSRRRQARGELSDRAADRGRSP